MFRVSVLAICATLAVYAAGPTLRTSNKGGYSSASGNAYNAYAACPFQCSEDQLVSWKFLKPWKVSILILSHRLHN